MGLWGPGPLSAPGALRARGSEGSAAAESRAVPRRRPVPPTPTSAPPSPAPRVRSQRHWGHTPAHLPPHPFLEPADCAEGTRRAHSPSSVCTDQPDPAFSPKPPVTDSRPPDPYADPTALKQAASCLDMEQSGLVQRPSPHPHPVSPTLILAHPAPPDKPSISSAVSTSFIGKQTTEPPLKQRLRKL